MNDELKMYDEEESVKMETSAQLLESITDARSNMDRLNGRNESLSENSKLLEDTTGQLVSSIESIHQFVNNINNISNQTNMLALNASIEAARTGAAGAGFAVVAKSMASLSADTKNAANQILVLLNQLDEATAIMKTAIANTVNAQQEQNLDTASLVEDIKKIEELTNALQK